MKRCRHCGIFFFTDRSNIQRDDLGCPFGCRDAHRKKEAAERCAQYRHTDKGRERKRKLNRKRYLIGSAKNNVEKQEAETSLREEPGTESIIRYVRMVTSLVEGRWVSLKEVEKMLHRISSQHPLTHRRRMDYIVDLLNKGPP